MGWLTDTELAVARCAASNPRTRGFEVSVVARLLEEVAARRRSESESKREARQLRDDVARLAAAAKNLALATPDRVLRAELERLARVAARRATGGES